MSILGFDLRDYTDPDRMTEESLGSAAPCTLSHNTTGLLSVSRCRAIHAYAV